MSQDGELCEQIVKVQDIGKMRGWTCDVHRSRWGVMWRLSGAVYYCKSSRAEFGVFE